MTETGSARTVLVTGASSGIGAAIVDRLLAAGNAVIGVSRQPAPTAHARYRAVALDLSRLDQIRGALHEALAELHGLDALVSNAGQPAFGNLEQIADADVRRAIDVNLTSHILVTKAVLPLLKRRPSSAVVFIGSESALRGGKRGSVYCATKFGLRGFAQSLRVECAASGTRVTIINPGMVRTPFFAELDFQPGEDPDNALLPTDVADAVGLVLAARTGTVYDEINLSPLKKVVRNTPTRGPGTRG